jgi:serine/threonine protein kinase
MAPEILEVTKIKDLNEKCDIFSLGLTIIEILFKVELPQNGVLWRQIRNENFTLPNDFLNNSNINEIPKEFFELIYGIIHHDPKKRFDIQQIIENFPEIKLRMDNFKKDFYINTYENFAIQNDTHLEVGVSKSNNEKNFI